MGISISVQIMALDPEMNLLEAGGLVIEPFIPILHKPPMVRPYFLISHPLLYYT